MPYDYPGGYAGRFDGVEPREWCAYFTAFQHSEASRTAEIRNLRIVATARGRTMTDMWFAGGPAKTLLVDGLSLTKTSLARWRIRAARPAQYLGKRASGNEVAMETLTIAHEGIDLIR